MELASATKAGRIAREGYRVVKQYWVRWKIAWAVGTCAMEETGVRQTSAIRSTGAG